MGKAAAFAAAAIACMPAAASAAGDDRFQFDAFGTLGLVHSSEDLADFTRSSLVPKGAGASQRISPRVDSVLGGQVTAHFTPSLSAVVQVVSEYRHDDSYDPRVEWANLRYEITPDLAVVAGRIASPIFKLTDTRRIAFSLPWVRPPLEVYDLYPVTSNDGIYLDWRTRFGDTTHLLEVAWGRSDSRFSHGGLSGTAEGRNQLIVRSTFERGALAVNLGYSPADLTVPEMLPLFDAFRQFGPQGEAIADQYEPDSREARYYGVGVAWDPGPWFAMAEWARLDFDGVLASKTGWYVSAGLRRGAFTPYATWAKTAPKRARTAGLDLTSLPPESATEAAALNAQLNYILNSAPDQDTFTFGVRWDVAAALSLKLQHSHVDLAPGSVGTLGNLQPGFVPGGKVNLISLSASFVL